MKAIMRIFTTDLKNILTNWVALVIILTLIMLPSLYAWFNIKATWDPYGNTKKLAVAVTNQDRGTNLHGKYINVGNEIIHSLKDNRNLGWTFVDERHALNGVKHGQYYASIIIPDDFSKKITSILNANPKKPVILFSVNEKVNAIAPKLTSAGATGIIQEISRNFVKTVSESIFSTFNKLGLEIERDLPTIEKLKELIFRIENDIPEINRFVNVAWEDILKAQSTAANVQENIPKAQKIAKSGIELSGNLSTFLNSSEEALLMLEPVIKENLVTLSELANSSQNVSAVLQKSKSRYK
jgi:putative membrane protein